MSALPDSMTVVEIQKPGGPEVLATAKRKVPKPGVGELLIKVAAAGINGADLLQREGRYPLPPGITDILGLEVSGTVVAAGEGTSRFKAGDPVCALVVGGGYAEYCIALEGHTFPIPKGVDLVQAGGLPEVTMTVWVNVFEHGAFQPGETVLVHGGSSGIGTCAIQLVKALGAARVLATAGNAEKCAAITKLGADPAIDYKTQDFSQVAKLATSNAGVDLILDLVGAEYLARNLDLLRLNGRLVMIAMLGGSQTQVDLRIIQAKHLVVTGSRLRSRSNWEKQRIRDVVEKSVWPLYATGKAVPVIDSTFPLAQARQAHERMHSGKHIGKVLLTP